MVSDFQIVTKVKKEGRSTLPHDCWKIRIAGCAAGINSTDGSGGRLRKKNMSAPQQTHKKGGCNGSLAAAASLNIKFSECCYWFKP